MGDELFDKGCLVVGGAGMQGGMLRSVFWVELSTVERYRHVQRQLLSLISCGVVFSGQLMQVHGGQTWSLCEITMVSGMASMTQPLLAAYGSSRVNSSIL